MKRLDRDKLECKFSHHGSEYLGEKWMGSCPTWECGWFDEEADDPFKADLVEYFIDNMSKDGCSKICTGYTPVAIYVCDKHANEYTDICDMCEEENDARMMEEEKKIYES